MEILLNKKPITMQRLQHKVVQLQCTSS